jgi:hypothetical protein
MEQARKRNTVAMQRNNSQRLIELLHMDLQGCVQMVKESRVR